MTDTHPELQHSSLPQWTSGLAVGAAVSWVVTVGLFVWDVRINDRLPDTAVTLAAAVATTSTLSALLCGVMARGRQVYLTAIYESKDRQADTVELPGLARTMRSSRLVVGHRPAYGVAAVPEPEEELPAVVRDLTKEAYRIARRRRTGEES